MIKALVGKFGSLALLAAVAGSSVVACSSQDVTKTPSDSSASSSDGKVGAIGLKLVPVSGVTINSVNYVVTGTPTIPGTLLPSGTLPTPGTASSFNFGVPVPVGTGYTLSLTASSAETGDDITCTGSFGPFNVTPNNANNISVTLTCRDNSNGQFIAGVNVVTDACPRLLPDYAVAIPGTANVNDNIAVSALGHDLDGKPVTYAWSIPAANAAVGSFAAAGAQSTSFHCTGDSGGSIPVTVTLKNGECSKPLLTNIACKSLTCGDQILEANEDCDGSIPVGQAGHGEFGCPANCKLACGNGVIEAPAEQCELNGGPPTATCTEKCRTRPPLCNDGFITAPETCDGVLGVPNDGSSCDPVTCTIKAVQHICGDGLIVAPETCEPGNSQTCSDKCQNVASDACVTCEQAGACVGESDGCLNFTGTDRANCFAVQRCITTSNCADGVSTLTSCFCGGLTTANCIAAPNSGVGAPAGACAAEIRTAMSIGGDSPSNNDVLVRFIDESVPGGAGIARYNCDKHDTACLAVCGF